MIIVRCSKCGKYIHKATQCYHCGNTADFYEVVTPEVHKNAVQDYADMEMLTKNGKYNEAFSLSFKILEWMPFFPGVFWLRLLAKNNCSNAIELIRKGFPCDTDSDFLNALDYSTGEEHEVYKDIQDIVSEIKLSLKREITSHKYKCISDTKIGQIRENMQMEINGRKQKLFSLWSDLEATEQSLFEIEADCRLLMKDYQTSMKNAIQEASDIRAEAGEKTECTAYERHSILSRMGSVLQQYTSARDTIRRMNEQHPWVKTFSELVSRRDAIEKSINSEITTFADYKQSIQLILNKIEQIEKEHKKAYTFADHYIFLNAAALIGSDAYDQILIAATAPIKGTEEILSDLTVN